MAKYSGVYACGHEGTIGLIGKHSYREWKYEQVFSDLCPECKQAQREKEIEEKYQKAIKTAEENELPKLVGSEKQVKWAESIRYELLHADYDLEDVNKFFSRYARIVDYIKEKENVNITKEFNEDIVCRLLDGAREQVLMHETSAKSYINNRQLIIKMCIDVIEDMILLEKQNEQIEDTIIIPTNSNGIRVEIIINENLVITKSQKDSNLISILKENKYKWDSHSKVWYRKLTERHGSATDRAAEIGNKLLANGYITQIKDKIVRYNAINGIYEEENSNYVYAYDSENIVISWEGYNDYLYNAAKSLPSAKWESYKGIIVSIKFKDAILDFIDEHNFRIDSAAEKLLDNTEDIETIKVETKSDKLIKTGSVVIPDLVDED